MTHIPRVFIGSSKEGLELAYELKSILSSHFEAIVWNETVFTIGQNYLTDLHKATLLFDFAVLIGTADDKVSFRGTNVDSPRDNITFELGLFLGKLGSRKVAYMVDNTVKLPTDLDGINHAKFKAGDKSSFVESSDTVLNFLRGSKYSEVNFIPSVVLAAGYYGNFIAPLAIHIATNGLEHNGASFKSNCRIKILIPKSITANTSLQGTRWMDKFNAKRISVEIGNRHWGYRLLIDDSGTNAEIIDFPTTLGGINEAVKYLLPYEFNHQTEAYHLIMKRELATFVEYLQTLLNQGGIADLVCFEYES